ncbi:hypothetical protein BLNAU_25150 [Blattamonas nauphoetae]|uniref:Uncharacterized protein n=1 Tax=Blattamonas nauphoetae TaxID=2049346 RepID=A0ABQ9WN67_9EUKA|nr:hypothetical protein BLNAU_25150 [Blattamonas nauphoetae]
MQQEKEQIQREKEEIQRENEQMQQEMEQMREENERLQLEELPYQSFLPILQLPLLEIVVSEVAHRSI